MTRDCRGRQTAAGTAEQTAAVQKKDPVQRAYFLDRDIDKALEEEKNLTETVNEILRKGLSKYLQQKMKCNRRLPKCKPQAVYVVKIHGIK